MSEFVVVSDPRSAVRVIALSRPEKKSALTRAMYEPVSNKTEAREAMQAFIERRRPDFSGFV